MRKWKSCKPKLLQRIETYENLATKELLSGSAKPVNQIKSTSRSEKVLGIPWNLQTDTIKASFGQFDIENSVAPTKRIILRSLATICDPVGLVSPIFMLPKVLFQELCLEKMGWDDPLPAEKVIRWNLWVRDLKSANEVTIPRCYYEEGKIISCSLHGFGDASKIAYSAVIYLVCQTTVGTYVKLVASKTRIAPLKQLSIPRLGLSAKILVALMNAVKTALKSQVKN